MKRYPFAKLYLTIMVVLASVCALAGLAAFIINIPAISRMAGDLRDSKKKPIIVDTKALVEQMNEAVNVVKHVNPAFSPRLPDTGRLPIATSASIKGRDMPRLHSLVNRYDNLIPILKQELLSSFDAQILAFETAAHERLNQIYAAQPPSTTSSAPDNPVSNLPMARSRLYEESILSHDSRDAIKDVSSFLKNDIQHYLRSPAAKDAALAANNNIIAIWAVYENDYNIWSRMRAVRRELSLQPPRSESPPANTISEIVVLRTFLRNLENCKLAVHRELTSRWIIEQMLSDIKKNLNIHETQIKLQSSALISRCVSVGKHVLWCISSGLFLLIIRDFLSAAIDTAQNTGAVKDSLLNRNIDAISNENENVISSEEGSPVVISPTLQPDPSDSGLAEPPIMDVPDENSISCPECGRTIPASSIHDGSNTCPHCSVQFIVE
jgi:hypothetical protein